MKQYGVGSRFLDVIVSDFSRPLWKSDIKLDAIITDRKFNKTLVLHYFYKLIFNIFCFHAAPYGIREAVEKIGTQKSNPSIEEHQLESHIPSKVDYKLRQLFIDLLNFSVKHLKLNGRLVFWFPIFR